MSRASGAGIAGSPRASAPGGLAGRSPPVENEGGSNSVVESQPSKLLVAGSIPVSRSMFIRGTSVPRTPSRRRSRGPVRPAPLRRLRASGAREGSERALRVSRANGVGRRGPTSEREGGSGGAKPPSQGSQADVAQLAERVLGKDEVTGSIPVIGSSLRSRLPKTSVSYGWQAMRRLRAEARGTWQASEGGLV